MATDRRGEVWLVDLGYAAKTRPAVIVIVPTLDSDRALIALIPHTTSLRGTRFEVPSSVRFLKAGAFDTQNVVTVPESKLLRKLGKLSDDDLDAVLAGLLNWFGIKPTT